MEWDLGNGNWDLEKRKTAKRGKRSFWTIIRQNCGRTNFLLQLNCDDGLEDGGPRSRTHPHFNDCILVLHFSDSSRRRALTAASRSGFDAAFLRLVHSCIEVARSILAMSAS